MVDGYLRWDAHGGLVRNHGDNARAVDQPIAGLLADLEQRGLLDETLAVWSGGRPAVERIHEQPLSICGFAPWG